jgi:hypothetical protein
MERPVEQIRKLKCAGAVDADGHILESAKCWEEYCDAKFGANAVRLKEDKDGLEYLEDQWRAVARESRREFGSTAPMGQVTRTKGEFDRRIKYRERFPLGPPTRRSESSGWTRKGSRPRLSIRACP